MKWNFSGFPFKIEEKNTMTLQDLFYIVKLEKLKKVESIVTSGDYVDVPMYFSSQQTIFLVVYVGFLWEIFFSNSQFLSTILRYPVKSPIQICPIIQFYFTCLICTILLSFLRLVNIDQNAHLYTWYHNNSCLSIYLLTRVQKPTWSLS